MELIKNYKHIIMLLLPFFLGLLTNHSSFFLTIYVHIGWIISVVFMLYWFWVGKQFGQLKYNKLLSFMLGNVIWVISFGLFIWQFVILNDLNRNMFWAAISQHYALFTIIPSTRIILLFGNVIDSTVIVIISYTIMLAIFLAGFIYGSVILRRMKQSNMPVEEAQ